ncbi:hypothetical protein FOMPIDRAFT_1026705 [Fomitopsis schrenkii]|uniref:FAD-binding domain-containing protein n=1 Tax=Fomitopsis schrenkii TaxID=2126942 RepID=S8DGU2_FOMSC|nr:hypothetical protein FOMPIDRAFT_1026705 [Fomitopsis schrenkii]
MSSFARSSTAYCSRDANVALTLAEAGHRVRVIEKRGLGVPAGGVRVPPNASKLLARWVPREDLLRIGVPCTGSPLRYRE